MKSGAALVAFCISGAWLAQEPALPVTVAGGPAMRMSTSRRVEVTLRFDRPMPPTVEVIRLVRDREAWTLGSVAHRAIHALSREMTVAGVPTVETLLLLRATGLEGYLLDGPFRWPHEPSIYFVSPRWRRTLRGHWPRSGVSPPKWIGSEAQARPDPWPRCAWTSDSAWECLGVPLFEPGLVMIPSGGQLTIGAAPVGAKPETVQVVTARPVGWARLVTVRSGGRAGSAVEATLTVGRDRADTAEGLDAPVRLDAVSVNSLGSGVFMVAASARPDGGWIEIAQPGMAPVRVPMHEVISGPIEAPLRIALEPSPDVTRPARVARRPCPAAARSGAVAAPRAGGYLPPRPWCLS